MIGNNDYLTNRVRTLEREVERLKVKESPIMSNYLLTSGKAADSDKLDGIDSTGFATTGHDHDSDYLGITAKAADSDKLDGLDSTAFRTANSVKLSNLTINDDVAVSFTPTNANGFLLVRKLAGATFAIVAYDATSSTAYAVNMGSSSNVNVTTGALTGTTGTDAKLTVSAHTDGKIYIENRLGATVYIGYVAL